MEPGFWTALWLAGVLVLALLGPAAPWPAAGQEAVPLSGSAATVGEAVTVDGVKLDQFAVAGRPVHYDRGVSDAALANVGAALDAALTDVPRLGNLPSFATPLALFLLADRQRFRSALAELGGVRVELVNELAGAYAVQRGDTMLLFFQAAEVDSAPSEALLVLAHELAHLAVREASRARSVPQWFNEGYAAWLSKRVLAARFPREAAAQWAVDRAAVASALISGPGLLPWSELVTRSEFNQAGIRGATFLEYGQSTLFIDWLAGRYGVAALAEFLLSIGNGATAGQAFQATFGPFGTAAAEFDAALVSLPSEVGPGLHPLSECARVGQDVAFAIVGGAPGERGSAELRIDGEVRMQGAETLDATGFLVLWLGGPMTAAPGRLVLHFDSPSLGPLDASLMIRPAAVAGVEAVGGWMEPGLR